MKLESKYCESGFVEDSEGRITERICNLLKFMLFFRMDTM